mgnify:CR=1 FL=1
MKLNNIKRKLSNWKDKSKILEWDKRNSTPQMSDIKYLIWALITKKSFKEDHKVLILSKIVNSKLIKLNNLQNISDKILLLKSMKEEKNNFKSQFKKKLN